MSLVPELSTTSPDAPARDDPDAIVIDPLAPLPVVPLLNTIDPDDSTDKALADLTVIDPEDDTPPGPLTTDTDPPVAALSAVRPAWTYMWPPSPLLVVPTVKDMDPARPLAASPPRIETYPASPSEVEPVDRRI